MPGPVKVKVQLPPIDRKIKALLSLAKQANIISRRGDDREVFSEMWNFTELIGDRINHLKKKRDHG